jgi:hypothetical protein
MGSPHNKEGVVDIVGPMAATISRQDGLGSEVIDLEMHPGTSKPGPVSLPANIVIPPYPCLRLHPASVLSKESARNLRVSFSKGRESSKLTYNTIG